MFIPWHTFTDQMLILNFCLTNDDDLLNLFLIWLTKNIYGISGEVLPVQ